MFDKAIWYDWDGANAWIFSQINSIQGEGYDQAMLLLSRIADHRNFPYYLMGLLVYVLVSFTIRKVARRGGAQYFATLWFATFMVLVAGYAADGAMVKYLKNEFHYPRPYIASSEGSVRLLDPNNSLEDADHSFPSGHESFATLMVVGLWPTMGAALGWTGVLLLIGVGWSRMAVGMHFPADVLGGFLLTFILVLIIRKLVYGFLRVFLGLRC